MSKQYPLVDTYLTDRGLTNVFYSESDAKACYEDSLRNGASEDGLELVGNTLTILRTIKGR